MKAALPNLSITTLAEPGVTVLLVAGLSGCQEVAFLVEADAVRALWPTRAPAARRPERPLAPGLPSLATILRGFAKDEPR